MVETLNILKDYHGEDTKVIIWEHNTHVGDARATNMANAGLVNVGQLVREQHEKDGVYIAGFASYKGSVIAGDSWGAPMKKMNVPEATPGSIESILNKKKEGNALVIFKDNKELQETFSQRIGHRAIGVVYNPNREQGNYVPSKLSQRYDALLFLNETQALHPLKISPDGSRTPETYPFGV